MIHVLITDDDILVRISLLLLLSRVKDIRVIAEARDGQEAIELADQLNPDVVTMDIQMSCMDGLKATRHIHTSQPHIKVLVAAGSYDEEILSEVMLSGASGYLGKMDLEEFEPAIRAVYDGKFYLSKTIAEWKSRIANNNESLS